MFKRIVELIKEALRHFVSYDNVSETITNTDAFIMSNDMIDALELWKSMYKDNPPWADDETGIFSLGIPKQICQSLAMQVLAEMDYHIVTPGNTAENEADKQDDEKTRAGFITKSFKKSLEPKLSDVVEKAMALGGVIIKPYYTGTGLYYDFSYQGEFVPIAFDDDGNIIDIAFLSQFTEGNTLFTKVERQTFDAVAGHVTIANKAFMSKISNASQDSSIERYQLGTEIPLSKVPRWAGISETPVIVETDRPMYGYYKVPLANNIDFECPLGISVFSPAVNLIKRTDYQFSRLDWEYEGGQMAIDIDQNALTVKGGYYGTIEYDKCQNRLYRKLDLGIDDTYNVFAPQLRDDNYRKGLNTYLSKIEDLLGIARGTLNDDTPAEARTATEIRILKQRTYTTISTNQAALEKALADVVYATNTYANVYKLTSDSSEVVLNIEWQDSVLSDTQEELNQRLQLKNAGVLSDVELRMWYTGEDRATAEKEIQTIKETALADQEANMAMTSKFSQNDDVKSRNGEAPNVKKSERDNDRKQAKQREDNKKVKE